ncbi:hypothetical protein K491DRAFT_759425 [Lophiostoma macrostomum CBS 122681]|uniref:Zn(2)-C6 fungal-type domain-containing protein n=1 Tax=Lophiostoma macrostomum CBS 122681 TaxID=1314788 RepID=A0A6A6T1V6_9PLEO|nr:hypothetical protein K491DRAFT_759425 [Lophiostoma macrostomum CBS 122681]
MDAKGNSQFRGACSACFASKRKCDRKFPSYSQCGKHRLTCEPRIFKHWKAWSEPRKKTSNSKPRRPARLNQAATHSPPPPPPSPMVSPEGLVQESMQATTHSHPSLIPTDSPERAVQEPNRGAESSEDNQTSPELRITCPPEEFANSLAVDCDSSLPADFLDIPVEPLGAGGGYVNDFQFLGHIFDEVCDSGWPGTPAQSQHPSPSVRELETTATEPRGFERSRIADDLFDALDHAQEDFSSSQDVSEPLLAAIPLPDPTSSFPTAHQMPPELLMSVDKGFLWHHFLNRTALDIFCYDYDHPSTPSIDENIFRSQVPSLAYCNKALLAACLALSGVHYDHRQGVCRFTSLVSDLVIDANGEIEKQFREGQTNSTENLIALCFATQILCTCFAKSTDKQSWDKPVAQSRLLVSLIIERHRDAMKFDTPVAVGAIKGYRYLEVISGLSFGNLQESSDSSLQHALEECRKSKVEWQSTPEPVGLPDLVVDPLLAFSPRLVPPLRKLGLLVKAQARLHYESEAAAYLDGVSAEVDPLEEDMLLAYELDGTQSSCGSRDAQDLLHCNISFHAACHLIFYSRLRDLPASAPIVRRKVKDIVEATAKIPISSRTSNALAFPLFTAGCEAIDSDDRLVLIARLSTLEGLCFSDILRMKAILRNVWDIRDLSPGSHWTIWVNQVANLYGDCLLF